MAATIFWNAKEVEDIAEVLIPKYHQHLIDFQVKLKYVFTNKTSKKGGKEVLGTCRKISGMNAFLSNSEQEGEPYFVIIISKDVWDVLPPEKREALVDHELCHAGAEASQKEDTDGEEPPVKLSVKPHDLEEFSCIVRRHGLWQDDIKDFVESAQKKEKQDNK